MSATSPASMPSAGGGMDAYRNAIASIESAGSGDYAAIGPTHPKLGRALGRYQVMEANIGPWSEKHLGRRVTADEFMASPELQDAIFDGEFGSYVSQYGPEGAAQAWFGGPGGVGKTGRSDVLGTTIGEYGQKFNRAMGAPPAEVASLDPSIGMPAAAGEIAATNPGYVDPAVSAPNALPAQAAIAPNSHPMAPQLPAPINVATPPAPQQQQMLAQALTGGQAPQPAGGISPQMIQQLLGDEWTADIGEKLLGPYMEQQMQANDPLRQLQLQKGQLEIEQLRNPRPELDYFEAGGDRYRINKNDPNATPELVLDVPDKPTTDIQEYEYARQQGFSGTFSDFQQQMRRAGATSVNVGGGENRQVFDAVAESATAARAAVTGLNSLTEARKAVEGGIISGAGADTRLGLQRVGALLGVVDPEIIQNTETFRSAIAPQVAAMMKATVGSTQISNADREFAQQAAGGSIALNDGTIRRLLDVMERAGKASVQSHMDRLNKVYPEGQGFDRERALFGVDLPVVQPEAPRSKPINEMTDEELEAIANG